MKAGETATVEFPLDSYLTITQVSIPDLPVDGSKDPVRVYADVSTALLSSISDDGTPKTTENSKVLLATLLPGEKDLQQLNICFSALNIVKLTNAGKCDVHVVGYLTENNLSDEHSDEEEEEEEEATEQENVMTKLQELSKK